MRMGQNGLWRVKWDEARKIWHKENGIRMWKNGSTMVPIDIGGNQNFVRREEFLGWYRESEIQIGKNNIMIGQNGIRVRLWEHNIRMG